MKHITPTEKLIFTKHLGVMIKAGIPLAEALATLEKNASSNSLNILINKLRTEVESGESLSKAIKKHPESFDQIYQSLIEIGEESGSLDNSLNFLAQQLAKLGSLRKKIQAALLYPSLVIGLLLVIGTSLSLFVLPKLVDFFSAFDQQLPLSTRILLGFANLMKNHGLTIVISTILVVIASQALIRLTPLKKTWDRFLFQLPFVGNFLLISRIAEISRNMSILVVSGVPLLSGLSTLIDTQENTYLKSNLISLQDGLKSGKSLSETIEHQKLSLFPSLFGKMIAVGEQTGKLDEMLLYLAEYYEEDIDNASKNLATTLEPVLLIIVGLMVGFLALAIISPIYQITGSIGGI